MTTEIQIVNRPEQRQFNSIVSDLKRFGGTFDARTKTWVISEIAAALAVEIRRNTEYNATYPEREAWPTTPAGIIKDRYGKYVAITERTIDPALDMANIDKSWSAL